MEEESAAAAAERKYGWLYNADAVAKVQLFFGLECVSCSKIKEVTPGIYKNGDLGGHRLNKEGISATNGVAHHRTSSEINSTNGVRTEEVPGRVGDEGHSRKPQLGEPNAPLEDPVSYRVHNKFWYFLFAFGASLGDDIFYFTVYPFWFFNISSWVIRRVVLMWGILMYIGQSSKEILKMPRPTAPPVAPLERRYFQEYGMPSTHALVGTLIPFTILFVTWDKVEYPSWIGVLLASSYSLLVCVSRLYRGMHYILDIIVGIIMTFILMFIAFQFLESLDTFLITHPYAPFISIATAIFLSIIYPTQDGWSSTRADTIVIMGVTTGIYTCLWLRHQTGMPPRYDELPPPQIRWPDLHGVGVMMGREVIGVALMGVAYFTFKTTVLWILSIISGLEMTPETKKKTWVEIPYKYITYFAVCTASNFISPIVFEKIGL